MSKQESPNYQVIVIGAGLSGLSAAKWLHEAQVNVVVLEARDRVGGRTLTKRDPKVKYVDLGGAYVGPTQNHLIRLARELGVETYKVYEEDALVYYHPQSGCRRLFQRNTLPSFWNPFVNMDINNLFRSFDELGKEIPVEAPWEAPHADEWDRITVKDYVNRVVYTQTLRDMFRNFINVNVTSSSYEASFLWFLWYIKQCGGTKRIFSTTNGGQERKFVGGSQQISEKMAQRLGAERVRLRSPVTSVSQRDGVVTVATLDGATYRADYVIFAVPPPLQQKFHFDPPLPTLRNQLIQRVPMGSVIKVNIYYERAFWRERGMCGSTLIVGDDDHPLSFTLDDTKPDGSHPSIIGFIVADKARRLSHLTPDEKKQRIARSLAQTFGCPEALQPVHYEEHNWLAEQYSGGCYTVMYPPGCLTTYARIMREPFGRVYFASTETAVRWSGYMDGAVSAGERAAREVLHAMGRIGSDQIWRQEPESKEIRPMPFPDSLIERLLPSVGGFVRFVKATTLVTLVAGGLFVAHRHLHRAY